MPTSIDDHTAQSSPSRLLENIAARPSRLAVHRILSDAAQDIRHPLASVRESIRMVARGELGTINDTQVQYLVDAIDVCDSIDRLVGDMLHLERLHLGKFRAIRSGVDLFPICQRIALSMQSSLDIQNISISMDGIDPSAPRVFGDGEKIGRLITHLIAYATREATSHQSILLRGQLIHHGETMRVTVVASGSGISFDAWQRLTRRGNSGFGADGVGMTICRQLATAHHTPLTILSRVGQGTEYSFDLPVATAAAVASHWTQWRTQQRGRVSPRRRFTDAALGSSDSFGELASGIGHQRCFSTEDTHLLLMNHDGPPPVHSDGAMMLSVEAGAAVPRPTIEWFNERLHHDQRAFDLVYRVAERRWVVVWDANAQEVTDRIESLSAEDPEGHANNLRLHWSAPRRLNLNAHSASIALADTITRESLYDRDRSSPLIDDSMTSDGPELLSPSAIPVERLQAELRHLTKRVQKQSQLFTRQAIETRRSAPPDSMKSRD